MACTGAALAAMLTAGIVGSVSFSRSEAGKDLIVDALDLALGAANEYLRNARGIRSELGRLQGI